MTVFMDQSTLLLLYNNIIYDFKGLFSIKRLFCLGLITGASILDGINYIMECINPDRLPIDIIEDTDYNV